MDGWEHDGHQTVTLKHKHSLLAECLTYIHKLESEMITLYKFMKKRSKKQQLARQLYIWVCVCVQKCVSAALK